MKVKDAMTKNPNVIDSNATVLEAAKMMKAKNFGCLPISENDKIIGMITDRDLTLRVIADKKDPENTRVKEVMTKQVWYCFEEDSLEKILQEFGEKQVNRMPVMDSNKRLVGEITLGDIALAAKKDSKLYELVGRTKEKISKAA